MDRRTTVATLSTSLVIGLAGDYLFRAPTLGIGASLWVVMFAGAVVTVDALRGSFDRAAAPGLAAAVVFAGFLGLRATPQLQAWNVLAVIGCLVLSLLAGRRLSLPSTPLEAYLRPGIRAALSVLAMPLTALWPAGRASSRSSGDLLRRSLLAVIVTVPLLFLFGTLLVSADPLFERLVRRVFAWDLERAASHVFAIGILAWLTGGYLIASRIPDPPDAQVSPNGRPVLGLIEVGTPMAAVTVLFAAFVAVQFRYLFGGAELIRTTVGLSVAEYARRGFFELIAASGLVIPLIVGADWLLRGSVPRTLRRFRTLAAAQLVLVGCVMASALGRLRLYYESFGLTTERVLALAVMAWIGLTLGWAAFTVLRGLRERFPVGAVLAGLAVLAALNVVNPEAVVARANLSRHAAGESLDIAYLGRMSADAVPAILARAASLPAAERCPLVADLASRHVRPRREDWRAWNLSLERAHDALTKRTPTLPCEAGQSTP
jgi:hypothetical protein